MEVLRVEKCYSQNVSFCFHNYFPLDVQLYGHCLSQNGSDSFEIQYYTQK